MHYFDKLQRKTFPQFKANELASFPIPDLQPESWQQLEELGRELETLYSKAHQHELGFHSHTAIIEKANFLESRVEEALSKHYGFEVDELKYLNSYSQG